MEVLQTQDEGEEALHNKKKIDKRAEKKKEADEEKNVFDRMGRGLENIHPLHVMNEGVKVPHQPMSLSFSTL